MVDRFDSGVSRQVIAAKTIGLPLGTIGCMSLHALRNLDQTSLLFS
jgi:hypothetical protein